MGYIIKLRPGDKRTLDAIAASVSKVKGKTSSSEVVGLSLKFASSNIENFLDGILDEIKDDSIVKMMRKPARNGERTDSRRVEEYLNESR